MTRLRRRPGLLIGALLVLAAALPLIRALPDSRAELIVICSNAASVCDALADGYGEREGVRITVIRVPTSEALGRLASAGATSEFDLWLGGPSEAHAEAERLGLLARPTGIDASGIPPAFHSESWFGIYGGILAFCAASDAAQEVRTWEALATGDLPVIAPLPLTSGTAATMLNVSTERLGGIDAAIPFLRRLDGRIETYTESGTDPAHLVAIARAPIGVSFDTYCELERARGAELRTVYPADGTGFEVGAASIPAAGGHREAALGFLNWVVSDEGQALAASVLGQAPISTRLPGHLSARLEALEIPVFGRNPARASLARAEEIAAWETQVYAPASCPSSPEAENACAEAPRRSGRGIDLGPASARTLLLAALSGALATLLGALVALGARFAPRPSMLTLPLAALPALVPAAVTAEALVALGAAPYRWTTLGIALALNAMPFAALIELYALGTLSGDEVRAARDLGAGRKAIALGLVLPALGRGALPAFAVATLMAASDVSASTVFGGAEPLLASLARHSLNAGLDSALAARILLLFLLGAAVTSAILLRWVRLGGSHQWSPAGSGSNPLRRFALDELLLVAPTLLLSGFILILTGILIAGSARALGAGSPILASSGRESIGALLSVPFAAFLGFLSALIGSHRRIIDALALFFLLASPVAGGVLLRLCLAAPLVLEGRVLVPSLVGGGAPAGGLFAVLLAHLLLTVPAAHFLMGFALSGTRSARRAAEDLGAGRLRTALAVIVPMRTGRLLAAIAALCALTMSMSAPAAFVVPAGSAFPPVALIPSGIHGSSEDVLLLGALGGASALAMILLGIAALVTASARSTRV